MELKNAHTREFLPEFALPASFLCDALDGILGYTDGRLNCLPAPLTLESCLALTDDEMRAYYEQYGLAKYYPDISHERRAWFLYMQNLLWRSLGTPTAVETLCTYLFDYTNVSLSIYDNLAFDKDGNLVDESLLDTYDAELTISKPYLPYDMLSRVLVNIIRFSRNSQWLRAFVFLFEAFEKTVGVSLSDGDAYSVEYGIDITGEANLFRSEIPIRIGQNSQSFSTEYEQEISVGV